MKHILIATDAWHPQINGVVRTLDRLGSELRRRGLTIDYVTPSDFRSVAMPGYREIRLALVPPGALARRIGEINPDHIHIATEGPIGLSARRACLSLQRRFTTSYHTRFPEYLAARVPIPEWLSYAFLKRFHNSGGATLVATPSLAEELKQRGFTKVARWSRGVDLDRFSPMQRVDLSLPRPVFLYVGRLAVEKSVEDFLKLDLPGTKLVVGDGPQRAWLEQQFPEAHFAGVAEGAALAGIYAGADVMVFPSRTDTFGLVVLEALASGTPVAAYPVTGPKDILDGSGAGVVDENLTVAAMSALAINRARCVAHASRYSWDASVDMFMDAVMTVSGGRRDTPTMAASKGDLRRMRPLL